MTAHCKYAIAILTLAALFLTAAVQAAENASAAAGAARRVASSPTTTPPTVSGNASGESYETQPFIFSNDQRRATRTQSNREGAFSLPALFPVFLAISIICALFIGALYLAKKYLPGHRQLFSHPAMEVLGRTHLDPKRYISLVRVGKRILVLGVTMDEITSLSEIVDDGEITEIMEVARPKTEMGLTLFQRLFQKQVLENEAAENAVMAQVEAEKLEEQMSSLRDRVRAIRESEAPERHVDAIG